MTEGEEQARARQFEKEQAQNYKRWKEQKEAERIHQHNLSLQPKPILQQVQEHSQSPIVRQVQAQTNPVTKPQPSFFSKLIPAGALVFSRLGEAGKKVGRGLEMGAQRVQGTGQGMTQTSVQSQKAPQMRQMPVARPMPQQTPQPQFSVDDIERNVLGGGTGMSPMLPMGQPSPVMRVKRQLKMKQPRQVAQPQPQAFDMDSFESGLMGSGGIFGGAQTVRKPSRQAKGVGMRMDMNAFERSLMGSGDFLGTGQPVRAVRRKIRRHHTHKRRRK